MKMGRRSETTTKVFVGSLPPNVTTDDLKRLFAPYGAIAECDIANRCGFLHLEDKDLAMKAIEELNNTTFMGGRISVEKGRVKPPGRRGRNMGPMRGGDRDRGGPYSRDRPRNGGYERDYPPFGGDRFDYDKPMPPRNYDGYDRRQPYEDRRPFPNGYERRPPSYPDNRSGFDGQRGSFDERRVPPGPGDYEDRRPPPMNDRRPMSEQPPAMGGPPRPLMTNYGRNPVNDMYSRRDSGPKPLMSGALTTFDRPSAPGYNAPPSAPTNYPPAHGGVPSAYASPTNSGYGGNNYGNQTGGGYDSRGGYGDRAPPAPPTTGSYNDNRNIGGPSYPDNRNSGSFSGGNQGYDNVGEYGDNYGNYDTSYPPLPQRGGGGGGFGSGVGGGGGVGTGPRRDIPPSRRY